MIEIQVLNPDGSERVSGIHVEALTTREALMALKSHPHFDPLKTNFRYLSKIESCNVVEDLEERLTGKKIVVRILEVLTPRQLSGSGDNPYVRIVIGVVLIVVALASPFIDPSGSTATVLVGMGISLVVGGFIQLLTPQEEAQEEANTNFSARNFQNTVASGTPIPIVLGEHMWGGHVFSANIDTARGSGAGTLNLFAKNMWESWGGPDSWTTLYKPQGFEGSVIVNGDEDDGSNIIWDDATFPPGFFNFTFG